MMKNKLLAAGIALTGTTMAWAQSSVTLYGMLDTGLETLSNQGARGPTLFFAGNGGALATLFGLRGAEDLGGANKLSFQLEGNINLGNGTSPTVANTNYLFNREAALAYSGPYGAVKIGLQADPAAAAYTATDPRGMAQSFSGLQQWINAVYFQNAPTSTALNIFDANAISYGFLSPSFGFGALYAFGNSAGSTRLNSLLSTGAYYQAGPLLVAGGLLKDQSSTAGQSGTQSWNLGAGYSWNALQLKANYLNVKSPTYHQFGVSGFGGNYKIGAWTLNAAAYNNKDKTGGGTERTFTVGGDYALSKRTGLYAQLGVNKESATGWGGAGAVDMNGGTVAPGQTANGVVVGMHHSF